MKIQAVTLCDKATVREGLLHLLGAGLNMFMRSSFPAALAVDMGLIVDFDDTELARPHELTVRLRQAGGDVVSQLTASWQSQSQGEPDPDVASPVPIALSLQHFTVVAPGLFTVETTIDDTPVSSITVRALLTPTAFTSATAGAEEPGAVP